MFDFIKKKIKEGITKFSKKVEEPIIEKKKVEKKLSLKDQIVKKFTEKTLSINEVTELLDPLEMTLLQSNVAMETIEAIKEGLITELVGKSVKRGQIKKEVMTALHKAINNVLIEGDVEELINNIKASEEPVSIMFVGTNGSGKTTTISKFAKYLNSQRISCVLAACDTFRAAAIQQLEVHGKALGIKVIKHDYGSDAAAVAYDALEHARAKGIKVVLIDTAGRSHSNTNLMKELEKVNRVVNPEYTIFVGDALTGNDVVSQCREFGQATGFDYAILTKTDVDERGGAILSVSYETGVPILFLGTGQTYKDLKPFKKEELIAQLL